jgi:hypothetical protein
MSFKVGLSKLVLPHNFSDKSLELPTKMTPKTHPNRNPGFGPCFCKNPPFPHQVLCPGHPGHWWKDEAPLNVAAGVGASFHDRWRGANHVEQSLGAVDWEI